MGQPGARQVIYIQYVRTTQQPVQIPIFALVATQTAAQPHRPQPPHANTPK